MARQISIEEVLKAAFWDQMERVYTSIPAVVVNVRDNFEELRVDLQPSINLLRPDGTTEPRAVILNVPVLFPATSTSALTMPINVGDPVACHFSMRAMELFSEGDGKPTTPNNFAKFDKKDAFAVPGLFPRKNSINKPSKRTLPHSTKDTVLVHNIGTPDEVEVRLTPSGSVIINCKTAVVNATESMEVNSPTTTWNGDIDLTGTLTASTDVIADGKSLKTHIHGGVSSGLANTDPPT